MNAQLFRDRWKSVGYALLNGSTILQSKSIDFSNILSMLKFQHKTQMISNGWIIHRTASNVAVDKLYIDKCFSSLIIDDMMES